MSTVTTRTRRDGAFNSVVANRLTTQGTASFGGLATIASGTSTAATFTGSTNGGLYLANIDLAVQGSTDSGHITALYVQNVTDGTGAATVVSGIMNTGTAGANWNVTVAGTTGIVSVTPTTATNNNVNVSCNIRQL
jgi:hypothetical protein